MSNTNKRSQADIILDTLRTNGTTTAWNLRKKVDEVKNNRKPGFGLASQVPAPSIRRAIGTLRRVGHNIVANYNGYYLQA